MSLAFGHQAYLGWAQEVAYGTQVHPPTKFIEIETESLKAERRYNVRPLLGHVSQRRTVKSKMNVSGSFKADFVWEGMEQLLKHALGSVVTSGVGPYTHTYALAAALPEGLSFYVNRDAGAIGGSSAFQYSGCKISKLTLTQEMEMPLILEAEILGRDRANVALVAATFPTYDCPDYAQMTIKAVNPASENIDCDIKSWTLVIDNAPHDDQFRLGDYRRAGIGRGSQRKVTLEAELEFSDEQFAIYQKFRDLTTSDFQFKWVSSTKSLTITIPKVTFDGEDPASGDAGPYYLKLSCTALANAADHDELSVVLVNGTSSVG